MNPNFPTYVYWKNIGKKVSVYTPPTRRVTEKTVEDGVLEDILGVNLNNEATINNNRAAWANFINDGNHANTQAYLMNIRNTEQINGNNLSKFLPPFITQIYSSRLENMRDALKKYNSNGSNFPYTKSTSENIRRIVMDYEIVSNNYAAQQTNKNNKKNELDELKRVISSNPQDEQGRQNKYIAKQAIGSVKAEYNEIKKIYDSLYDRKKSLEHELTNIFYGTPVYNIRVSERRDDDDFIVRLWGRIQTDRVSEPLIVKKRIVVNDNNNLNVINEATGDIIEENIAGDRNNLSNILLTDKLFTRNDSPDKWMAVLKVPLKVLPNGLYIESALCAPGVYWRFRTSNKINTTRPLFNDVPYDKLRDKDLIVSKISSTSGVFRLPTGKTYFDLMLCIDTPSGVKKCSELVTSSDLRYKLLNMVKTANKQGLYKNVIVPLSERIRLTNKAVDVIEKGAGQTIRGHGQMRHIPGSEWQLFRERTFNLLNDGYWPDYPEILSQTACLLLEPTITLRREEYQTDLEHAKNLRVGFGNIPFGGIFVLCEGEDVNGPIRDEIKLFDRKSEENKRRLEDIERIRSRNVIVMDNIREKINRGNIILQKMEADAERRQREIDEARDNNVSPTTGVVSARLTEMINKLVLKQKDEAREKNIWLLEREKLRKQMETIEAREISLEAEKAEATRKLKEAQKNIGRRIVKNVVSMWGSLTGKRSVSDEVKVPRLPSRFRKKPPSNIDKRNVPAVAFNNTKNNFNPVSISRTQRSISDTKITEKTVSNQPSFMDMVNKKVIETNIPSKKLVKQPPVKRIEKMSRSLYALREQYENNRKAFERLINDDSESAIKQKNIILASQSYLSKEITKLEEKSKKVVPVKVPVKIATVTPKPPPVIKINNVSEPEESIALKKRSKIWDGSHIHVNGYIIDESTNDWKRRLTETVIEDRAVVNIPVLPHPQFTINDFARVNTRGQVIHPKDDESPLSANRINDFLSIFITSIYPRIQVNNTDNYPWYIEPDPFEKTFSGATCYSFFQKNMNQKVYDKDDNHPIYQLMAPGSPVLFWSDRRLLKVGKVTCVEFKPKYSQSHLSGATVCNDNNELSMFALKSKDMVYGIQYTIEIDGTGKIDYATPGTCFYRSPTVPQEEKARAIDTLLSLQKQVSSDNSNKTVELMGNNVKETFDVGETSDSQVDYMSKSMGEQQSSDEEIGMEELTQTINWNEIDFPNANEITEDESSDWEETTDVVQNKSSAWATTSSNTSSNVSSEISAEDQKDIINSAWATSSSDEKEHEPAWATSSSSDENVSKSMNAQWATSSSDDKSMDYSSGDGMSDVDDLKNIVNKIQGVNINGGWAIDSEDEV